MLFVGDGFIRDVDLFRVFISWRKNRFSDVFEN